MSPTDTSELVFDITITKLSIGVLITTKRFDYSISGELCSVARVSVLLYNRYGRDRRERYISELLGALLIPTLFAGLQGF